MPLPNGTRLGPYEIVGPLGAGGMGEVYRAHDTRLGRDVAIKVLPQHLAATAEVRARFEREARTISQLHHPHICALYDVGSQDGTDYLVMELIEGETLAGRLSKGVLPAGEVIKLGAQIAEALDAAHRSGVIHRDLKPGNIMLTRNGARLMDFGLARATGLSGPKGNSLMTQSPTAAVPLTAEGTLLGTFQYMAPEQLEGREADARSDLWALGCVLYEMATGRRAFDGGTQASLISAIMRDHPRAMSELAPMSPPMLDRLVNALLAKDPDERIQTAHDARLQLQWMMDPTAATSPSTSGGSVTATPPRHARGAGVAWGVAALSLALALAAWLMPHGGRGDVPQRARLLVTQPPGQRALTPANDFAISPDGRWLVFVAADSTGLSRIWLRPIDGLTARPLPGTERSDGPFWSPDSRSLGFFADGALKVTSLEGGTARTLCQVSDPRGGTWSRKGVILFAPMAAGGLFTIPEDGGAATELIRPDSTRGELSLRYPCFLPDGERFTFAALPTGQGGYAIQQGRLGTQERTPVMRAEAAPVFAEPGWLVTLQSDRLVAVPFDARSARVTGKPVTISEAPAIDGPGGVPIASASRTGILAYPARRTSDSEVVWLDRSGRIETKLALPADRWDGVVISHDGRRAVISRRRSAMEHELVIIDLGSGQTMRLGDRATLDLTNPVWSPDSRRVLFGAGPIGANELDIQSIDATQPELLYKSEGPFNNPYDWSPDGRFVTFESPGPETGWDLWGLPVDGDRKPIPLVRTKYNEGGGWFSPDGHWLVYYSDESGSNELYVQSFPTAGARFNIPGSATGSSSTYPSPCSWSSDGRELLFSVDGSIRVVNVEPGPTFRCGRARVLFDSGNRLTTVSPMPDHQHFLATVQVQESSPPDIAIDMNWTAALPKR